MDRECLKSALTACLPVILLLFGGGQRASPAERTLDIYFLDMEGGAAELIVTPLGESVLIDSGTRLPDRRDARRIHEAAKLAGLSRINEEGHPPRAFVANWDETQTGTFIKASVEPDGKAFTVQAGRAGQARRYTCR